LSGYFITPSKNRNPMKGRLMSAIVREEEPLPLGAIDGRRDGDDVDGIPLIGGEEGTVPPLITVGDFEDNDLVGNMDGDRDVAGDAVGREEVGIPELFPLEGNNVGLGVTGEVVDREGVSEGGTLGRTVGP
jgi:hypothetical protein